MILVVRHLTAFRYPEGAAGVALRLKLLPQSFEGQRVIDWHVSVDGAEVEHWITGGYGERFAQWLDPRPRDSLDIVAWGQVETRDRSGVVSGLRRACPPAVFLRDTPLTWADEAILALGEGLGTGAATLTGLHDLSARVREALPYRAGVTGSETPAAQALAGVGGVCQDHAHVFIAAARCGGVPARYVAGYLMAGEDEDQQFETHAWAEAFVEGLGWVGFDVANGICPTDRYVRIGAELDAHDAAPVRGLVVGGGAGDLLADVRIAAGDADLDAVLQQQQ